MFEGLQNVGANRGGCPFAFNKESLPGFGVEGDEVYFALSVPPASDSVKVERGAVVKVEFEQEFSRDIFKGKAHKFRYAGIETIEKVRKVARFVDTQLTVDESHPESDKGVADFIATFFGFPRLLGNGHFAFDEVKQVGQFAQVFGQASGRQSGGAGDFRAAGFSGGDGFEDCQIGVGSATKFGEDDIAHFIAKGGKGGEQRLMENLSDGAAAQSHAFYNFVISGHAAEDAVKGKYVCGRLKAEVCSDLIDGFDG